MEKEELRNLMDQTLEQAKKLLSRDGKLVPVAFVHVKNEILIIGLTFRNPREKNIQINLLKKLVKEENADAVFVAIESWYVNVPKLDNSIVPSRHPDRKECILLTGESEEEAYSFIQLFERKGNEIIFTEKIDMKNGLITKFNFGIRNKNKDKDKNKDMN